MNTKKLLALILAIALLVCALPLVYAAASDAATEEDTDIGVDVEDLPEVDVSVIYGDADGDGEVTAADAAVILQYVAGWDVAVDSVAADVDADGEVTAADAATILQYVAGWDVVLGG